MAVSGAGIHLFSQKTSASSADRQVAVLLLALDLLLRLLPNNRELGKGQEWVRNQIAVYWKVWIMFDKMVTWFAAL